MSPIEEFQNPQTLQAIVEHLQDPLQPNQQEWAKISPFVENPVQKPLGPGGLTALGRSCAEKLGRTDILSASQEHEEKTRIHVHCVLKACQLYTKLHQQGALPPIEDKALKKGIALQLPNGKTEFILTVVKGGELLAKPLQKMMEKLFKCLKKEKNEFHKVLALAASLHKRKSPDAPVLPLSR
jgi:hypothetical protein